MPQGMQNYLRYNGWHFTEKMCAFAVSRMRGLDGKRIKPWSREEVDGLLAAANVIIDNNELHDYVFVANMCKADYYNNSITTDDNVAKFVKDYIDDPDGYDGLPFTRWYADMRAKGIPIDWEAM